jgi:diguanylate cyclase (GGDEF)-like protein
MVSEARSNPPAVSPLKRQYQQLIQYLLVDLLTGRNHQSDFDHTRAEYIKLRLTTLLIAVSPYLILWIGIDYYMIPGEVFISVAGLRILTAAILLSIGYRVYRTQNLQDCKRALLATLVALNLFYYCCQILLADSAGNSTDFGYSLFPFLYICMLTIFPLTALESILMGSITIATVGTVHWNNDSLTTFSAFSDFWFLVLLLLVALWAQMAQLHMLMRLYRQATRDPLTGLLNRRKLMENMTLAVEESQRKGSNSIMLIFDLDHFKRINDTYGHQSGDKVLQNFSRVLEANMRDSDSIGRYGGEEFVCMLPHTNTEIAMTIAERVRQACEKQAIPSSEGEIMHFTTSVGVTQYQPPENLSTFIDRADDSLYAAKHEGRNRVVLTD